MAAPECRFRKTSHPYTEGCAPGTGPLVVEGGSMVGASCLLLGVEAPLRAITLRDARRQARTWRLPSRSSSRRRGRSACGLAPLWPSAQASADGGRSLRQGLDLGAQSSALVDVAVLGDEARAADVLQLGDRRRPRHLAQPGRDVAVLVADRTLASRSSITLSRIGSMTSIGGLRERSPCSR
jgi:hypothetical protein